MKPPVPARRSRSALLAATLATATLALAPAAGAQDVPHWYAGGTIAPVWLERGFATDYDRGLGLSGFVGHAFGNGLRAEGELGWQKNDFSNGSGDARLFYGMASGFYDFAVDGPFVPYIGGGIGVGETYLEGTPGAFARVDDSDTSWLWHLSAGGSFKLTNETSLFGGYRYLSTFSDPSYTNTAGQAFTSSYDSHLVQAGIRIGF